MAEVLRDFGIWLTDPGRRERLAASLVDDGATPAEIAEACGFVERGAAHDPERTGSRLALILKPGRWRDGLKAARRATERKTRAGGHDHGETRRDEDGRAAWLNGGDDRDAMQAYSAMHHEGKSPKETAGILGIGVDKLPALLRQGAETYGCPDPDKAATMLMGGQRANFARWMVETKKDARNGENA